MKTSTELASRLADAQAKLERIAGRSGSGDPAVARLGGRALTQFHRNTDANLQAYAAQSMVVARLEGQLARARGAEGPAPEARTAFTAADLTDATHVLDRFGWHEVVRVNAKSVTVKTQWSWTERVAITAVLRFVSSSRVGGSSND